jgi:hypothetical protein
MPNVKIEYYVRTDKIGSKCEDEVVVDKEEWEGMSEAEKDEFILGHVWDRAEWGYDVQDIDE